jgi:hypothetical protein
MAFLGQSANARVEKSNVGNHIGETGIQCHVALRIVRKGSNLISKKINNP